MIWSAAKQYYPEAFHWVTDYHSKVIHGAIYQHVSNLEYSIHVLESILKEITAFEGNSTFAITADYGAFVGHKISKREKKNT